MSLFRADFSLPGLPLDCSPEGPRAFQGERLPALLLAQPLYLGCLPLAPSGPARFLSANRAIAWKLYRMFTTNFVTEDTENEKASLA